MPTLNDVFASVVRSTVTGEPDFDIELDGEAEAVLRCRAQAVAAEDDGVWVKSRSRCLFERRVASGQWEQYWAEDMGGTWTAGEDGVTGRVVGPFVMDRYWDEPPVLVRGTLVVDVRLISPLSL